MSIGEEVVSGLSDFQQLHRSHLIDAILHIHDPNGMLRTSWLPAVSESKVRVNVLILREIVAHAVTESN